MPTAGVGGIAIFVNAAKKDGHPTGKVTLAAALFVLFDYAAFLAVLALGMIVLIRRNDLNAGEITASLILLAIASVLGISPSISVPAPQKRWETSWHAWRVWSTPFLRPIHPPGLPARRTRT